MFEIAGFVAATIIFVWSDLFLRIRTAWPKFLNCPMCVGFWVGFGGSILERGIHPDIWMNHFFQGTIVSILSFATYLILKRLEKPLIEHGTK